MRTIKLAVSFDGTAYCGWQKQHNGPTIQEELERAVSLICNSKTTVHGSGRTDAGVHALGMTAHFRTASRVSCPDFLKGLNSLLPEDIRINSAVEAPPHFHARFSALAKTYRYAIFTGAVLCPTTRLYRMHAPCVPDLTAIRTCLKLITGTHDFASFETAGSRDKSRTGGRGAVRTVYRAECLRPENDLLHLLYTGDGFLRHMVRNLSGTILAVGRGRFTVEEFEKILANRDRNTAGATAPARGLTLLKVHYQKDWEENGR